MKKIVVFSAIIILSGFTIMAQSNSKHVLLLHDPLTSSTKVKGESLKVNRGGEYNQKGWRSQSNADYLMIEISELTGFEGALEVDLTELDWASANTHVSIDKIHFINMFSSPRADHHVEDGGTNQDALWTLRGGKAPDGSPAYGNRFAVLWSSRGAKRCDPSDYEESVAPMVSGWKWDKERYTFRITWSKRDAQLLGYINGEMVFHEPWANQVKPLQYIYLAKGPEFGSFVGPYYSNLKVYRIEHENTNNDLTPVVSILSPRTGSVLPENANIELLVEAEDDGKVTSVELMESGKEPKSLGIQKNPPFRFSLTNLKQGWYVFTVKATDNSGQHSESRPVYVTVGSPWKPWGLENLNK